VPALVVVILVVLVARGVVGLGTWFSTRK